MKTALSSIDPARLENVKRLDGGSIRAACPACRVAGSDKTGDHLLIQPDGKFGCAVNPGDGEHRKEIFRLALSIHPAFEAEVEIGLSYLDPTIRPFWRAATLDDLPSASSRRK